MTSPFEFVVVSTPLANAVEPYTVTVMSSLVGALGRKMRTIKREKVCLGNEVTGIRGWPDKIIRQNLGDHFYAGIVENVKPHVFKMGHGGFFLLRSNVLGFSRILLGQKGCGRPNGNNQDHKSTKQSELRPNSQL